MTVVSRDYDRVRRGRRRLVHEKAHDIAQRYDRYVMVFQEAQLLGEDRRSDGHAVRYPRAESMVNEDWDAHLRRLSLSTRSGAQADSK